MDFGTAGEDSILDGVVPGVLKTSVTTGVLVDGGTTSDATGVDGTDWSITFLGRPRPLLTTPSPLTMLLLDAVEEADCERTAFLTIERAASCLGEWVLLKDEVGMTLLPEALGLEGEALTLLKECLADCLEGVGRGLFSTFGRPRRRRDRTSSSRLPHP